MEPRDDSDEGLMRQVALGRPEADGRLPPAQRAVVTMRVWNGLSYHEIAEAVGRSEATVRSHMFHALAAIRRHLEPRMK